MAAKDSEQCNDLLRDFKDSPAFMSLPKEHFFRQAYSFTIRGSTLKEIEDCYKRGLDS